MTHENAKWSESTKQYSWMTTQRILKVKAMIGTTCPMGHAIVGYHSKRTGIIGAYCLINTGTTKRDTPQGVEQVERAQIQFTDHSQEPFWVDLANIVRRGSE